ncbi:alpha/beta-hydrolase [Rhizopus microsporus ATCC 52813]|uniref:Alpha/beta-hydrolase n=1 Tax=Rhizopus microsporus ATCC 52813 TaxID=1340429 RepID=A0A2G4T1N3_RHIZD|nr:alpha/beta-hydrolase [Rhizopus microsporus ATCC 52813]PHZ14919.1 alpha/beta-hydrolase [Rhizopus microsporus ATCC 52813]
MLDVLYHKTERPQDILENTLPDEVITQDETYYAEKWGYISEKHEVVTEDGYIIIMYRLYRKGCKPSGMPVLIGHGLFQCSGAFVLNEEKSIAFTLADEGYDVWVGNNRAIAGYDHISLSYKDPEYWDWGLKELGIYDFKAMLDHVREYSGYSRVAYIGHSQGNAQAFIGLSLCPEIANKLSCFVALAPAIFSGTLVNTYPLRLLINLNDWLYSILFGTAAFLPVMTVVQTIMHPRLFCFLAYCMFSYLFSWWDSHWVRRRKVKYFQFTPRPVSARLIADWIAGWGKTGKCLYVGENTHDNMQMDRVPLVVFYGTADYLVDGEQFVRSFDDCEHRLADTKGASSKNNTTMFPMLDLVHVERIDGYEHMDTIWGHNNHETTYPILLKQLKQAKWE